jgi:hypothetical protein
MDAGLSRYFNGVVKIFACLGLESRQKRETFFKGLFYLRGEKKPTKISIIFFCETA